MLEIAVPTRPSHMTFEIGPDGESTSGRPRSTVRPTEPPCEDGAPYDVDEANRLVRAVSEWMRGVTRDRGSEAARALQLLNQPRYYRALGQASFEALCANRLDIDPQVAHYMLEHGQWRHVHPPRLSPHGQSVLGKQARAEWLRARAPRSSDYVLQERESGPALDDEYARLREAALSEAGVSSIPNAARRRYRSVRDAALLTLLAVLGLRPAEVAGLRVSDYDRKGRTLRVAGRSRSRVLPVPQFLGEDLDRMLEVADPGAKTLFAGCDRDLEGCTSPPGRNFARTVVDTRWAEHVGPRAARRGAGDVPNYEPPPAGPSPSDFRALVEAVLSASPDISRNGVDETMGRRSRRKGACPPEEDAAIHGALRALDKRLREACR